jgi:hypothetical protein
MEECRYPSTTVTVCGLDADVEVPLSAIQSVSPPDEDGCIHVVYSVCSIHLDRPLHELRTGESTIEGLLSALGWHSDQDHRAFTSPLHH